MSGAHAAVSLQRRRLDSATEPAFQALNAAAFGALRSRSRRVWAMMSDLWEGETYW